MSESKQLLIETQYFPSIAFFEQAIRHAVIWIEGAEHYQKRSFRNRCLIAGPNGSQRLSVPLVKGKNEQQNIREVKIAYGENWQKEHWSAIQTAYGKSPFFEYYKEEIHKLLETKHAYLFDLNLSIIETICALLQFSFKFKITETYHREADAKFHDFRNQSRQAHALKYPQVFEAKNGFLPNLSILDLLFCVGPESYYYLENINT